MDRGLWIVHVITLNLQHAIVMMHMHDGYAESYGTISYCARAVLLDETCCEDKRLSNRL